MSNGANVAASDLILLQSSYNLFELFATRKLFLTVSFIAVTLEIIFCFILLQKHYQAELAMYLQQEWCHADLLWGLCELRNNSSHEANGTGPSVLPQNKICCFFSQAVLNHHPAWLLVTVLFSEVPCCMSSVSYGSYSAVERNTK